MVVGLVGTALTGRSAAIGVAVMAGNWNGREELRLRMLASPRKWGNHDSLTDGICRKILGTFGDHVNGLPNGRNGRFFAAGHSIDFFNVLDPKVLREAQDHPERYENLQVRVCGWNVRFNDLGRREQDAYILRAENVMK